ncbi:MAG: phosphoribosylamine--glycine ligase [Elusimicrobia bacterium]|nr:phosphoribosylamine--glycine ligase [Elusimicrobiota bacterium]
MKILVIGGGGREHAIIWKLKQNPEVKEIFSSPGNGGISESATLLPACAENDWSSYVNLVKSKKIDLTIVGPEAPLASGIVDAFKEKKLKIFGPSKECAQLEASKIFAKNFMKKHGIPTANFKVLEHSKEALNFLANLSLTTYKFPLVIKADGLAQGKGVVICQTLEEAKTILDQMMVKKIFGAAGKKIIVEDKLEGREVSILAFCDGRSLKILPQAQDYKRAFDQDLGPNTGGMGSIAPSPLTESQSKEIERFIFQPFLKGLQNENLDYRGIIYFGIMLTENGANLLEFNVRFGDPETQVILPLIETDLLEIIEAVLSQTLSKISLKMLNQTAVSAVLASGGYPGKYETDKEIFGLNEIEQKENILCFHAGTIKKDGKFFTSGGRVLNIVGLGGSREEAKNSCYAALSKISFEKMQFRTDIAS